ncbi:MAG: phosphoenolpyruvate-protein phosphotransferase [Herbinix sp.]|jgi:phosphotransferase system enzyme I (PtsI)|nr:phosphoenolpyruvate-protein phosphotransferase [Herbinix sp.]
MDKIYVARTVSEGIAIGKAFLVPKLSFERDTYTVENTALEVEKFQKAVKNASVELEELAKHNDIFSAHLEVVNDQALYDAVKDKIEGNLQNVQIALWESAQEFIDLFDAMDDEYMRERAADIKDVRNRLMCQLKDIKFNPFDGINEEVIVVAQDLTPSDTAKLNLDYVLGIITHDGGITSHVSIMAKNIGLPALVGVSEIMNKVKMGDDLIMDAKSGEIILNPSEEMILEYKEKKLEQERIKSRYEEAQIQPASTKDGHTVSVCVNVGSIEEVKYAVSKGLKGVGLFRSEFLYMLNSHFPTEEEQLKVYKEAAELCTEELTIRTLDIGGDKELSYFSFDQEENPFLGWRAIRICLDRPDIFKVQLRAILRASASGNVRIMLPMIISMEELIEAKRLVEECKKELTNEGISFDEEISVGMMIETPASVILAEDFAKVADFFSIGTNDLTQYILAVDRGNTKIAARYDSFHPAVLASIKKVIEAGHKEGIPVGMCGEMASDERAVELLLRMGLDEFSVAASCASRVKYEIQNMTFHE